MKDLKHIKRFNESDENLNISDVMNSKINESISVKDRLNKIERVKKQYGSESNQYIIIALTEITSILRDYFNVDEIEDDGPGGV